MMRKKQLLYVALAFMIFLTSFLSYPIQGGTEKTEGKVNSKDEVVYGTLNANGDLNHIYVVNALEVIQAGEILDYGKYSSVKNLTDLTELDQEGQKVRMVAPEGKFFYQGNMKEDTELPWDIKISYFLDGQDIEPSELAGKTGHVGITIDTAANQEVDSVFYDNYLLQVSLMLPNTYKNIEASGGVIVNAGKSKQITFTVMPGKEANLTVEADVEDFDFQGVEIAAVPSTLPIDTSNTESMTDDMSELSSAIGKLNNGVADLKEGVSQLNNGAANLRTGSEKYKNGMNEMDASSFEIVNASNSILDALETINQTLSGEKTTIDLTNLNELPVILTELANGMSETANGLSTIQENYVRAYDALDGAIQEIPTHQLTEEEIVGLYESGADAAVIDKLVASYSASQKVKVTYANVKEALDAVEPSLDQVSKSLIGMSGHLTTIANNLSASLNETDVSGIGELQDGLSALSFNYNEFHSGLVSYTKGLSQLSTSYDKLHAGVVELTGGTSELEEGVSELHFGTKELYQNTENLPDKIHDEINKMIEEYDKSDFKPVSFVSSENEKVSSVQFVIKTESIQKEEKETKKAEPEKKKGFWELLIDLFR